MVGKLEPTFPGASEWERADPQDLRFDAEKLRAAVAHAVDTEIGWPTDVGDMVGRNDPPPYNKPFGPTKPRGPASGAVIRHGYVGAEWGDPERADMTFSATKSLSTCVGLAVDRGMIRNVNDRVADYVSGEWFAGNQHVLDVVSVKMRRDLGIRMAYAFWPVLGGGGGANEKLKGRRIGHACIIETSMMMHLRPDLVREDKLAEGELQPPIYGEVDTWGIGGFVYWNEYTRNGAFEGAPDATQEIGENVTRTALERMIPFVREFAEAEVDGNTGFATL